MPKKYNAGNNIQNEIFIIILYISIDKIFIFYKNNYIIKIIIDIRD